MRREGAVEGVKREARHTLRALVVNIGKRAREPNGEQEVVLVPARKHVRPSF